MEESGIESRIWIQAIWKSCFQFSFLIHEDLCANVFMQKFCDIIWIVCYSESIQRVKITEIWKILNTSGKVSEDKALFLVTNTVTKYM